MQIFSAKYINKQTPAWLIGIAFLLSTALFTGYTGITNHYQSAQICRSWSANDNSIAKNTAAYHYRSAASSKTDASFSAVSFKFVLLHFTKLTQIKITTAQKIFNGSKSVRFVKAQAITNTSSSEISSFYSLAV